VEIAEGCPKPGASENSPSGMRISLRIPFSLSFIFFEKMISPAQMVASAVLGAFIGYFTNAVAIKSLFRPLRPRWYSLGWQGVIPRNRSKLANNISRVVGRDLLNPDYLAKQIQGPALQENLQAFVGARLEQVLGLSLADLFARLPASWQEEGLEDWVRRALEGLADWSEGEQALEIKGRLLDGPEERLRGLELESLLEPAQAEALVGELSKVLARDETRAQLTRVLHDQLEEYLSAETPLEEIVPAELRGMLHDKLREEVPAVMRRLASWLAAPENVEHMSRRVLAAMESYVEGEGWLMGELGLRLFGDQIQGAIVDRIPQVAYDYLHSMETRRKIEAQLVSSINSFLRRPLREVTGRRRALLAEKGSFVAAAWITSEEMQERLGRFLLDEYQQRAGRQLGELLPERFWGEARGRLLGVMRLSRESTAAWGKPLSGWLREKARGSRTELRQWAGLSAEDEDGLSGFVRERATEMLRTEVPLLVDQLDIERIVHDKIMDFDLLKVERMIKDIISEQLRYINLLGGVLGGLVGLLLPFLNAYLRTVGF